MMMLTSHEIEGMSPEERLSLIGALWDSLEAPALTETQRSELDRRLDALDQGEGDSVSWEEMRAELAARRR